MNSKLLITIFITVGILGFQSVKAQSGIGINTENVKSGLIMHVDPKSNNPATGVPSATQASDDVVISTDGNMGIGTISPSTKLHIVTGGTSSSPSPGLIIDDAQQQTGKVLMSDSYGAGRWADYVPGAKIGALDATGVNISGSAPLYWNTNAKISLDPGRWLVIFNLMVNSTTSGTVPVNHRVWVRATIGDTSASSGGTPSSDIVGSKYFGNSITSGFHGNISGRCLITNTGTTTKDYYIFVGNTINPGSYIISLDNVGKNDGYSSLFAFRIREY